MGLGFLTGAHGLAANNLLAARMVLANGDVVNVPENENAELFWAIRGGSPNLEFVTEFTYRVHKQGMVFSQILFFSPEKTKECAALANKMPNVSLEEGDSRFQVIIAYLTPPIASDLHPGFRIFYDGPEDRARELATPIYALGPIHESGGVCRFPKTTEVPAYMDFHGFDRYAASLAHIDYSLSESLVVEVFERFQQVVQKYGERLKPSKCILDLRNYQKVASVPIDAMAYSGRFDTAWMISDLQWDDPALDATMRREVTSITGFIRERMQARKVQSSEHRDVAAIYPNISAGGEEKAKSVFGPNLPRL